MSSSGKMLLVTVGYQNIILPEDTPPELIILLMKADVVDHKYNSSLSEYEWVREKNRQVRCEFIPAEEILNEPTQTATVADTPVVSALGGNPLPTEPEGSTVKSTGTDFLDEYRDGESTEHKASDFKEVPF